MTAAAVPPHLTAALDRALRDLQGDDPIPFAVVGYEPEPDGSGT